MRIELYHPKLGVITSDAYPEEDHHYGEAMKAISGCLSGTHGSINFKVEGNYVILPTAIVKQSVITVINETETKE